MKKSYIAYYCTFFVCASAPAGILLPNIAVQDYRDFGENLGKYSAGETNIPVYRTDGTLSGYLEFPMPDFGSVASLGYATLISPSYIASVRHNKGYKSVTFGNGAQYAATYTLINRNNHSKLDFHVPRLNKVVTDAAPVTYITKSEFLANYRSNYLWYTRVGAGAQYQVNEEETKRVYLAGAYKWKSGGTISTENVRKVSYATFLRYLNLGPDDEYTTPLSIGAMAGDSGSPVFAWDSVTRQWLLVAVHHGYDMDSGIYKKRSTVLYIPDDFVASVQAANTSPDVTDSSENGTITWGATSITQGNNTWSWQGLADSYKSTAPSQATTTELDATKDLRFNGDGGVIALTDAVNMGAGKLQFSGNYTLTSAEGVSATWVGGGVEVDADQSVLWQVNGLSGDALHKTGDGILHVNGTGINEGSLNTGAGTVILDQQADASGQKQAFSGVTLVSGRPTVVLADAEQISTRNIYFGYRGGTLDLNGNALTFKKINHTDSGAILVNHNGTAGSTLTLAGYSSADISFQKWSSTGKGTPGDIYQYKNPYSRKTEYFQLNASSYWYYPTNQTSTSTWTYLGTDASAVVNYRLSQLNNQVFRGFIGETDSEKVNGELDLHVNVSGDASTLTLSGGMNLNGNLNVEQGTVILSGQPVAHAGGVVVDDDWSTSYFKASQIMVNNNTTFQVGEYAQMTADVVAGESSRVMFGYNQSSEAKDKIWRCYSVIYKDTAVCSQPERSAEQQAALTYSAVTGDVSLASDASLYLGQVNYLGSVTSSGHSTVTLDSSAYWTLTGNSTVTTLNALSGSHLSMLPSGSWAAKVLEVDSLNATGMTLSLGVRPATAESDKLTIRDSATGENNVLDVALLLDTPQSVSLLEDVVMVDAPAGTAHDYFTLPDIARGFSLYTPNYEVKENDNRVQWLLLHNAQPEAASVPEDDKVAVQDTTSAPEASPETATEPASVTEASPETATEPASVAEASPETATEPASVAEASPETATEPASVTEVSPETATESASVTEVSPEIATEPASVAEVSPETATDAVPAESRADESEADSKIFSPDDWFTIQNNNPLISRTRALMAARQYIFAEALSGMNDRASLLRGLPGKEGAWVTIEQNKGGWEGFNINQQTLNVGWDIAGNGHRLGFSASHTQGKTKGDGQATHRLASAGVEYSWSSLAGWFVDASARYMHLNQTFSLDPQLEISGGRVSSHMVAGNVKTGYEFGFDTFTVAPYFGFSGGYLSGYMMKGAESQVALSSSAPYYATGGVEVKKRGIWGSHPDVMLTAGIGYQYAPGRAGSKVVLSDSNGRREYSAWSDNRYRVHAGLEGKLSQNLSVNARVKTSFGGNFKVDYSGMAGLAYHF